MVEDEQILVADIAHWLRPLGYSVVASTPSGAEAIDLRGEARPDLLLVDIGLRGPIDGIDAVMKIREQSDVPVIYLTAFSDEVTMQRAGATHPVSYIVKPYEKNHLLETITAAVPPTPEAQHSTASVDLDETQPLPILVSEEHSCGVSLQMVPHATGSIAENIPPAPDSPAGFHWTFRTRVNRPGEQILIYRDDEYGVQMQEVIRAEGARKGFTRRYFFIDGRNRVFLREERMVKALRRDILRHSLDDFIASWQKFAHSLNLL
jgi:CheY-like chemotaxis protein